MNSLIDTEEQCKDGVKIVLKSSLNKALTVPVTGMCVFLPLYLPVLYCIPIVIIISVCIFVGINRREIYLTDEGIGSLQANKPDLFFSWEQISSIKHTQLTKIKIVDVSGNSIIVSPMDYGNANEFVALLVKYTKDHAEIPKVILQTAENYNKYGKKAEELYK